MCSVSRQLFVQVASLAVYRNLTNELWNCHAGSLSIGSKSPLHLLDLFWGGHGHLPIWRRGLHGGLCLSELRSLRSFGDAVREG